MTFDLTKTSGVLGTDWLYEKSLEIILENQAKTGAFVASPNFGQYNYSWFRDGSFIALSLTETNRPETILASRRFHDWVHEIIQRYQKQAQGAISKVKAGLALDPVQDVLHCRYTLEGEPSGEDWTPFQIDGFGTWLFALAAYFKRLNQEVASREMEKYASSVVLLVEYLGALWQVPNFDCWEEHGDKLATSTLSALYGGLSSITELSLYRPDDTRLRLAAAFATKTALEIKAYILQNGTTTDPVTGQLYLTKFCGGPVPEKLAGAVDASLLWAALPYKLLPVNHPIIQATVERIIRDLVTGGELNGQVGVHRYRLDTYYGGGEWLLLTAWLAAVRLAQGKEAEAQALLKWIEKQSNQDGTMPEQTFEHLNRPDMLGEWIQRWGEVANPLIWSHASYITLVNYLRDNALL